MQLYGNGVTRNLMTIVEGDVRRAAKTVSRLVLLAAFIALAAVGLLYQEWLLGGSLLLGTFLAALGLGLAWGHYVNTYRYQRSIRENWNRWMRYSVSCVTVRECYQKVHGRSLGPSTVWTSVFIALLIVTHLVLGVYALNGVQFWQVAPLFLADAFVLGFLVGVRIRERRWYQDFLKSVNELLKEGAIGVWGVY